MSQISNESFSRDLDLSDLLDGIAAGTVALPNFQRDFDWNEPDVTSLLATVLCGWPAGSLLLMSGDPSFFKVREFSGAPPVRRGSIEYVVLDGQQRLTSLYHAFRGAGARVYALNVDKALSGPVTAELIEDALVVLKTSQYETLTTQRAIQDGHLVPLSAVTTPADYYDWRDDLVAALPESTRSNVSRRLASLYKNVLSHAHRYKFPAMLLNRGLQPEPIARIFERINKTGLRLSTFDLLVARSYTRDWNLREVWEEAREERPYLEDFVGEDGLAVAQALALRSPARDVRQPAVLALRPDKVQDEWDRHVDAMEKACEFLVDNGCFDSAWLPYRTQLIPLAALAVDYDLNMHHDLLLGWLWGSSLSMSYDVASSTVASDDYERLRDAIERQSPLKLYRVSRLELMSATRGSSGALWRTFRWLISHHKSRDIVTGANLTLEASESLTMVSLLPRTAPSSGMTPPHSLILAQVLAEKSTVRQLKVRPLGMRGPDELDEQGLESQFLPTEQLDSILFNWRTLVSERLSRIETYLVRTYADYLRFVD